LALLAEAPLARADYPVASHRYLADPGAMFYNSRLYVYCSNDDDNATTGGYAMKSIVCVSSADLKNWTDHGEVFRVPNNASWANNSWAPSVVARNGRFYLYFGNSASGIGVASSTSPTGTFTDAKGGYLVNSSTPGAAGSNQWYFDPCAFIDSTGQAYLYFGGNSASNARVIKLNSDMISTSGSATAISAPNFLEAAHMHKRGDLYYFTYSTNGSNGQRIDYLTSTNPVSGFTYRGTAAGQPPQNYNNNHQTVVNINGTYYHLYHNRSVASAAGIPTTWRRNLGIERMSHNADGAIQQLAYTTNGVPQRGNLDPYVRVEGETFNAQGGIETVACSEGGRALGNIESGDWVRIRGVNFGAGGNKTFSARVASANSGGNIELRLGSSTGTLVGTCTVAGTGGWNTWTTRTASANVPSGVYDLYLRFVGTGGSLFNINWWQFN
jgi:arabinoxylan arabinofuranohydrolase